MTYALQQLINGVTLGATYALMAMGLSLIMGVVNQINLAHGEIFMVAAFCATVAVLALELFHVSLPLLLVLTLIAAVCMGSVYGWTLNRVVFAPLRGQRSLAPLIATIGLAIVLQEATRLLQGAGNVWLQPVLTAGVTIGSKSEFAAFLGYRQIAIVALVAAVLAAFWYLDVRTNFGRAQRATAQDPRMAALLGINVDRVLAGSFLIAGALAGVAGFIFAVHYGVATFSMGFLFGLKAFTAAVIGGVGSVAGAAVGGFLLAMIETIWSGYFPLEYRDVVTFGILIAVIILRPEGILGRPLPAIVQAAPVR